MSINNRKMPRYTDFARAIMTELCQLPGILEDVCKCGCKIRFSHVFEVDTDREYTLTILPVLRSGIKEIELLVKPEWVCSNGTSLDIGFCILHSPGIRDFYSYLSILEHQNVLELQEA